MNTSAVNLCGAALGIAIASNQPVPPSFGKLHTTAGFFACAFTVSPLQLCVTTISSVMRAFLISAPDKRLLCVVSSVAGAHRLGVGPLAYGHWRFDPGT